MAWDGRDRQTDQVESRRKVLGSVVRQSIRVWRPRGRGTSVTCERCRPRSNFQWHSPAARNGEKLFLFFCFFLGQKERGRKKETLLLLLLLLLLFAAESASEFRLPFQKHVAPTQQTWVSMVWQHSLNALIYVVHKDDSLLLLLQIVIYQDVDECRYAGNPSCLPPPFMTSLTLSLSLFFFPVSFYFLCLSLLYCSYIYFSHCDQAAGAPTLLAVKCVFDVLIL